MTETDIEDRLRAAGTEFRSRPIPDVALRWPVAGKGRSRLLAPLAVAAGVAAVIVGIAVGVSSNGHNVPAAPATPLPQVLQHPDRNYAVALPPDYSTGGPALPQQPECPLASLRLSAATRLSSQGLLGLISIDGGDRKCSLAVDPSTMRLLGPDGQSLAIPTVKGNPVNPSYSSRFAGFSFSSGHVGFAWTGSYCGPKPSSIEISILGRPVRVPLGGPGLPCQHGASGQLIPGTFGGLDQAVEPAPVSWQALKLQLVLPARVEQQPIPLQLVVTNTGSMPVVLANPCPTYTGMTTVDVNGNISGIGGPGGNLCDAPRVIEAGRSVTITLPSMEFPTFSDLPRTYVSSGDPVQVTFSMAGVEPVTATSYVQ
jgi:hypothetical protein